MKKTNAIRILEKENIEHSITEYDFNENEIDAVSVAKKLNSDPEMVFKTLVACGDKNDIFVYCIPGNYELDLKKAAKVSKNKKIELIPVRDIFNVTGYIRGGCSPIGMKKDYPTFIDESADIHTEIYISAGIRGMQIKIKPKLIGKVINTSSCDLI